MLDEIVVQTQGHGEAVALHDGSMKGAEDDGLVEVVDSSVWVMRLPDPTIASPDVSPIETLPVELS
jgi:hypothetical protein